MPQESEQPSMRFSNDPLPHKEEPQVVVETPAKQPELITLPAPEPEVDSYACADIITNFSMAQMEKDAIDEKLLSLDQQRTLMRQRIAERLTEKGVRVSDAQLDAEIDKYFQKRFVFEPADAGMDRFLANAYVNRRAIAIKTGVPALALTAMMGIGYGAYNGINYFQERNAETTVEGFATKLYNDRVSLEQRIEMLRNSSTLSRMPTEEVVIVKNDLDSAQRKLRELDKVIDEYAPGGDAVSAVTRKNAVDAAKAIDSVAPALAAATQSWSEAEGFVKRQESIDANSLSIEAYMTRIRQSGAPSILKNDAERTYAAVPLAIKMRQVDYLQVYERTLRGKAQDAETLTTLPKTAENAYASIKAIAAEDAARTQGEQAYKETTAAVERADVPAAESGLAKLRSLDSILNQEYTVIVTGGNWRYPKNNPSAKNFYLIVEALDASGNKLTRSIRNEETGVTENVTRWGERVTEGAYEQVKRDKQDNGIIDNKKFGQKAKGYLNEDVTFMYNGSRLNKVGQITKWEDKR